MSLYNIFLQHPIITTDSRNCPEGAVFFALKGDKFNANTFAADALKNGCAYAVVDEQAYAIDDRYILVDDVLESLQELAQTHRRKLGLKIIGITGTNGKTTTKELIASVLKEKYEIHFTQGNLNNHIGVPLTILQLKKEHQLAIIEMGANHRGEIRKLCEIAQPDFGLITNLGKAHLEGFGSFEGVMQAKAELYEYIAQNGQGIFINIDHTYLSNMAEQAAIAPDRQIAYSIKQHPDASMVTAEVLSDETLLAMLCQTGDEMKLQTQLVGAYNAENVLAAATIGHFFGLSNPQIKAGIESFKPQNNRSQLVHTATNKLIVDAYNANPSSMEAAILNLAKLPDVNKMLILGDMLELGNHALEEHQIIINLIQENRFKSVYLVGEKFADTQHLYQSFINVDELCQYLLEHKPENYCILIKGSRGIQLEKTLSLL